VSRLFPNNAPGKACQHGSFSPFNKTKEKKHNKEKRVFNLLENYQKNRF
jgi:hypothetical protein